MATSEHQYTKALERVVKRQDALITAQDDMLNVYRMSALYRGAEAADRLSAARERVGDARTALADMKREAAARDGE